MESDLTRELADIKQLLLNQQRWLEDLLKCMQHQDNEQSPSVLSQRKAMEYLGVSRSTFDKLVKDGMIQPISCKKGRNNVIYYRTSDLNKLK